MFTGIAIPLEAALAAVLASLAIGLLSGRWRARRDPRGAAGQADDGGVHIVARARAAFAAARKTGSDHVVAASEINEVLLLPPPEPMPVAAAA